MEILNKRQSQDLRQYCEQQVFCKPLDSFFQIRGGAHSYTFLAELEPKHYIIQIDLPGGNVPGDSALPVAEKFIEHLIAKGSQYPYCKGIQPVFEFEWQGLKGVVLVNAGQEIPIRELQGDHIREIIEHHNQFHQIECPEGCLLSVDWPELRERVIQRARERKGGPIQAMVYRYVLNNMLAIPASEVIYPAQIGPIHRDFFNNNILFQEGHFNSFIDFDTAALGVQAEDFIHLILYNLRRIKTAKAREEEAMRLLSFFLKMSHETLANWRLAIHTERILWAERMLGRASFTRIWRYRNFCKIAQMLEERITAHHRG